MKTIVVSGVNLRKGGTLTILRQCLEYLSSLAEQKEYRIVALVHKKELCEYPHIEYIEYPESASSWFRRLKCEYWDMKKVSKQLAPVYLWLSLHDTTPNVVAERQAVYCHNSFPFFSWKFHQIFLNVKVVLFALFSKYIYKKNIHRNRFLIVQQNWLREEFTKLFGVPASKIIVALPSISPEPIAPQKQNDGKYHFMFASFGDIHKNFEVLCEATKLLEQELGKDSFDVSLTIARDANPYTKWLDKKWGQVESLKFVGFLSRDELYQLYQTSDCLVFPSLVETWGLPITEFSVTKKLMILADKPYAHETSAGSEKTVYFNPENPVELKNLMKQAVLDDSRLGTKIPKQVFQPPFTKSWDELFAVLLN